MTILSTRHRGKNKAENQKEEQHGKYVDILK
jgi:hypothetical protein